MICKIYEDDDKDRSMQLVWNGYNIHTWNAKCPIFLGNLYP